MSLNALNTATAGLQVTQAAIGLVSQNVANAGSAGYVKRVLTPVAQLGNSGVATGTITRTLDAVSLKQLRLETAGAAYTGLAATVQGRLDALFGNPGSSSALDGVMNTFTQSLQALTTDPTSAASRTSAIGAAKTVARTISGIADGVQDLRTGLEAQLGNDVASAGTLLKQIAALNTKVVGATGNSSGDTSVAELLDQRDQQINTLSQYLDVQVSEQHDGSVTLLTASGATLVDHGAAASLAFDGRGTLGAGARYTDDPATRGVGTVTATTPAGAKIDLIATGAIRSGSIAAAVSLRDDTLVQAQRQLDDLASGLSRAVSDRPATGTAASANGLTGVDIDLTGLQAGNAVTLGVRNAAGVGRNLILMPTNGAAPAPIDPAETDDPTALVVPVDISGGASTFADRIAAALGTGFSVSATPGGAAGSVRILSDPASLALTGASASVTVPTSAADTKTGSGQLALFVDAGNGNGVFTGSFEGGSHLTGFAQRLAVNPAVAADSSTLVNYAAATDSGDTARPQSLVDALTSRSVTFSAGSGIGGVSAPRSSTVIGFTQSVIDARGAASAEAQQLDEGQTIALSSAQSRFGKESGVSVDEEMSKLIQLQTAYSANARVLTAARDMLDTLLRI
ncbi:flagellar hook-associated protein FlgK [Methylobacterium platani]|uniref:Flagellar hook-associated protein 1 n=2 Tax=Methylobacterium platani TaxID=427683 RepID=A0A179SH03_9HYPH|nr:flagellar hook-associated protein FlgK [Methylobacterium platani]KMO17713.1 flagellar hook protein FlgK [Methylobacterium platani JCM 14648]OAS27157.1 flagellar biosynthesis protein FlgK [Methylobacterium platani]